jgi:hypothetical protein
MMLSKFGNMVSKGGLATLLKNVAGNMLPWCKAAFTPRQQLATCCLQHFLLNFIHFH